VDLPFFTIELARDTPPEAPQAVRLSGRASQRWRVLVLGLVLALTVVAASLGGWVLAGGDLVPLIGPAAAALASLPIVGDLLGDPVLTPGSAPLHLASQPPGATLWLDGRERGRTPLDLAVVPGAHTVVLRQTDSLEQVARVDVPPEGRTVEVALWHRHPEVQPLRAAYPGARVADATFLDDGRLAVATSLPGAPPGQPLREAWLVDPTTGPATRSRLNPGWCRGPPWWSSRPTGSSWLTSSSVPRPLPALPRPAARGFRLLGSTRYGWQPPGAPRRSGGSLPCRRHRLRAYLPGTRPPRQHRLSDWSTLCGRPTASTWWS
jgi:PEGA domain